MIIYGFVSFSAVQVYDLDILFYILNSLRFVRLLQKYLTEYHYTSPTKSGNHDAGAAVRKFQKLFHLPETEYVDEGDAPNEKPLNKI